MHNVVVIGDANVDIIVPYPRFCNKKRTKVQYPQITIQGGGTGANTAIALAKLGVQTSFIGTVGDDQYGRFMCEDFRKEHVDITHLNIDASLNTVGVFAFVDEYGERYLWGWPREQQSFRVLHIDEDILCQIQQADWVHSSGMCLAFEGSARSSIIRVFKEAYAAGIPTSFDLNLRVDHGVLDPEFSDALYEIIPYVTHLLGSGPEEFAYLGDSSWFDNAQMLSSDDRVVVARDGAEGSIGFTKGCSYVAPALKVNVIDTIGAGDVYNAGYIRSMLAGKPLDVVLREANAVSAYTVARRGARSSPTAAQLDDFLKLNDE